MFHPTVSWRTLRGMLIVETIAKIRRQHCIQDLGIKTICRVVKLR